MCVQLCVCVCVMAHWNLCAAPQLSRKSHKNPKIIVCEKLWKKAHKKCSVVVEQFLDFSSFFIVCFFCVPSVWHAAAFRRATSSGCLVGGGEVCMYVTLLQVSNKKYFKFIEYLHSLWHLFWYSICYFSMHPVHILYDFYFGQFIYLISNAFKNVLIFLWSLF